MVGDGAGCRLVGAPLVDRLLQYLADGNRQALAVGAVETGRRPIRAEAGAEQRFVGVNVADAGN